MWDEGHAGVGAGNTRCPPDIKHMVGVAGAVGGWGDESADTSEETEKGWKMKNIYVGEEAE